MHFIEQGVKLNGAYYRDNLLAQKLPDTSWLRTIQDEFFVPTGRHPGTSSTRHCRFPGETPDLLNSTQFIHSSNTVAAPPPLHRIFSRPAPLPLIAVSK